MPSQIECHGKRAARGNHCCIIWCSCILWFISIVAITSSFALMFCVGDLLTCTGTDIINAIALLCGLVMLPTNLHLMYYLSQGKRIRHDSKLGCCPLWMTVLWLIIISTAGAVLCVRRIVNGKTLVDVQIVHSMANYRDSFIHKRFIDNLQWALKCCGLNSYKDWFNIDWYDKTRDYEWPSKHDRGIKSVKLTDSVPYSCCKSGSCISNYLVELGTSSINTKGCGSFVHRLVMIFMSFYIFIFIIIIILECIILSCVLNNRGQTCESRPSSSFTGKKENYDVRQLMDIKDNFSPSSESYMAAADESDDDDQDVVKNSKFGNY